MLTRRICVLCGKEFETASSRRKMCYDDHYHKCPVCGKDVLTTDLQHTGSCCCKEHSCLLAGMKNHEVWNQMSDKEKAQIVEKSRQTSLKRYGVDNPSKSQEIKDKIQQSYQEFKESDRYDEMVEKRKQTNLDKYGVEHPMKSDIVKGHMLDTLHEKYGEDVSSTFLLDEVRAKANETNIERYGTTVPMQTHDVWAKQMSKKSKTIACDGLKLDSEYEKIFYEFCLRNDLKIKRSIPIDYEYQGEHHRTFVDFEVDGILFEVKGEHILQGYFDYQGVPIAAKLDVYRKHHVVVITGDSVRDMFGKPNSTESNGLKYLNKCPEPLIGVDLDLFKHPEFPYRKDRPKCFYDVRVNHQMSVFEAFNDESIRWKMIVNRIMYSGGFIDNNQILQALNISRTCKQPSWFSKSFAKRIISKYATEDVIVDPFAGWGARCDAATELHKIYIGCDLNQELVDWHHENKRFQIKYGDAKEFKYDGKCSVFICPPYQDVEVYFEDQDSQLTQCDWLKICMNNIPNASEYIMVCKVVDDGWEKYIQEVKTNKSHFGENNEYVIVIRNGASL